MPSLSDIFNPSFFMCLGILVLLTALIVVYFESKMREQNHKIASMLSLVSSLAEEQNNLRIEVYTRMITANNTNSHIINNSEAFKQSSNNDLINVSDDEEDDSDEDDDDSNDDSDEDSSNEDSNDSDSDSDLEENEVIEIGNNNDIKVLKLNINKIDDSENDDNNENNDFNINDLDDLDDELDDDSDSTSSDEELKEDIPIQNNLEELKDDGINFEETSKLDLNAFDLKQINISGLDNETYDYKKFSLGKLKSLAMEKGLTKDSSKLKKNELLKLLGDK